MNWFSDKSKKPDSKLKKQSMKLPEMPKLQIPKNINLKLPPNLNTKTIMNYILKSIDDFKKQPPSATSERRMKYPYTFTAKLVQFPYKHYYNNNWIVRAFPWGIAASFPFFWYCSRIANSKSNKETWKEIRRKEKEEARHKFDYV